MARAFFGIKLSHIALILLLAISFLARIWPLEQVHWWDETVYLQHGEIIAGLRENNYNELSSRAPLLPVFFAIGFLVAHSAYAASFIAALLGALGVLYIYLAGRELYSEEVGFLAAVLMAFSPFVVQNSHTLLPDVPALAILTGGFYHFLAYSRGKGRLQGILAGILFSLSFLAKFPALIPVIFILLFSGREPGLSMRQNAVASIQKNGVIWAALLATLAPYFIWVQLTYGFAFSTLAGALFSYGGSIESFFYYLQSPIEIFSLPILLGIILIGAFSFQSVRKKIRIDARDSFLFSWLLALLLVISLAWHKELRYALLPAFIPAVLLSARGISSAIEKVSTNRAPIKLAGFALLFVLCAASFSPSFSRLGEPLYSKTTSDEYLIAQQIRSLQLPQGSVLYTNFNYPVFAYYTGIKTVWVPGSGPQDFYDKFPGNMSKGGGILVVYDGALKYGPATEWLDGRKEFTKALALNSIFVYKYVPNQE